MQVRPVCADAGVSVGTFYNHFADREVFLKLVIRDVRERSELVRHTDRARVVARETEIFGLFEVTLKLFIDMCVSERSVYSEIVQAERSDRDTALRRYQVDVDSIEASTKLLATMAGIDDPLHVRRLRRAVRLISVGVRQGYSGTVQYLEELDARRPHVLDEIVHIAMAILNAPEPAPLEHQALTVDVTTSHQDATLDLILNATELVIAEKGTQSMTILDVSYEACVAPSSIYHYVESKDELVSKLTGRASRDVMAIALQLYSSATARGATAQEKVLDLIAVFYRCVCERGYVLHSVGHLDPGSGVSIDESTGLYRVTFDMAFDLLCGAFGVARSDLSVEVTDRLNLLGHLVSTVIVQAGWGPVPFLDSIELDERSLLALLGNVVFERASALFAEDDSTMSSDWR